MVNVLIVTWRRSKTIRARRDLNISVNLHNKYHKVCIRPRLTANFFFNDAIITTEAVHSLIALRNFAFFYTNDEHLLL